MITFGQPHRHVAECESTSDLARDWARDAADPAPSGALVSTDFQSRGRGQRGRQWEARPGENALMSFVYRLPPGGEVGPLALVVAVAVADALMDMAGLDPRIDPQIKWPNDILLEGRKTAGILVEVSGGVAVLGIGINVNPAGFDGAAEFVTPPTSLRLAAGREFDVGGVREAVGRALTLWIDRWRADGFGPILAACRERLAVGAVLRRGDEGAGETAALAGLQDDGAARVRLPDGTFARWGTLN